MFYFETFRIIPKRKPRQPATSKSLKANAGPKAMQRMLKQNLRQAAIHENKPRPRKPRKQAEKTSKFTKTSRDTKTSREELVLYVKIFSYVKLNYTVEIFVR